MTPSPPALPSQMRAVVLRRFGPPEVLRLEQVPVPQPAERELLLQVHAVSVNRTLDCAVRRDGDRRGVRLPHVLGVDPVGTVVGLGAGARHRRIGDRVAAINLRCGTCRYCVAGEEDDCRTDLHLGIRQWGGYAEYVRVHEDATVLVPSGLGSAEAVVIFRHVPTAFALARRADLQPGEWALVMGAAGALGGCCVQVARRLGARVIAAAGSDERVQHAMSFGAEAGVNYRTQDLAAEVMRITDGHGVDVVFENIADPSLWPGAFGSLAYRGRLVTAGAHGGGNVELDVRRLYLQRLRIIGGPGSRHGDVQRTLAAAAAGELHAAIDRVLPLAEAATAHHLVEEGHLLGKVILDPTLS